MGQVLAGPGVLLLGRIVRLGPGGNDALGSGATVRTVLAGEIFVVDRLHGGADSIWAVSALWERQIYGGEEIGVRQVQVPGHVGVAHQALHDVDVLAAAHEARGVGMPPAVWWCRLATPAEVPASRTRLCSARAP